MTKEDFKNLAVGDIVKLPDSEQSWLVTGHIAEFVSILNVRHLSIAESGQWKVYKADHIEALERKKKAGGQ